MTSSRKSKLECCVVHDPGIDMFWINVYEDNKPMDVLGMKKFSSLEEVAVNLNMHFPGCSVGRKCFSGLCLQYFYVHGIPEKVLKEHFESKTPML